MNAELKSQIENEIITFLSEKPSNTTTVNMWAWAYKCNYTSITPIFTKLVREGKIIGDVKSCVGNKIYKITQPLKVFVS